MSFGSLSSVVFAGWIFYALTTASVFVLRRTMPDAPRSYRTIGYPFTPLVFVLAGIWLLYNTLATPSSRAEAVVGLALIALGLPLYAWFRRPRRIRAPRLRGSRRIGPSSSAPR